MCSIEFGLAWRHENSGSIVVYDIKYHAKIEQDLFDIFLLIENYAGSDIARAKLSEFEKIFDNLSDFPNIGSVRNELRPGLRAIPAGEKGVVCFTVDEDDQSVFIICVTYAGANWVARIKEREE
jgi:toxin ParE1/3/4